MPDHGPGTQLQVSSNPTFQHSDKLHDVSIVIGRTKLQIEALFNRIGGRHWVGGLEQNGKTSALDLTLVTWLAFGRNRDLLACSKRTT